MIRKVRVKGRVMYRVESHRTGRNMGTYPTREQALKRLRQVKFFGSR